MEHDPQRRNAIILISIVYALVVLLLFVPSARADGIVLICQKDQPCTPETARIVFFVKVEDNRLPSACLLAANTKTAEVSDLKHEDELVRVNCDR